MTRKKKPGYLTYEECLKRWPRLARCCQWVAILSEAEAGCCLRDWRGCRDGYFGQARDSGFYTGGEAVTHFGGCKEVIKRAIQTRHTVRQIVDGGTFRKPAGPNDSHL